jgi:hypothetical protein
MMTWIQKIENRAMNLAHIKMQLTCNFRIGGDVCSKLERFINAEENI